MTENLILPLAIPVNRKIFMYSFPIKMRLGHDKLMSFCKNKLKINPETEEHVFLFFNKNQDQLRVFYVDDFGVQMVTKMLPNCTFVLPVSDCENERLIEISYPLLPKLLK